MFGIWPFIKKVCLWTGLINPPKGTGRLMSFCISPKPGVPFSSMEKTWQKVFKGTEYDSKDSQEFEDALEGKHVGFRSVDGVIAQKAVKTFKSKNGFRIFAVEDVTRHELDKKDLEDKIKILREKEKEDLNSGDLEKAATKKLQISEIQQTLRYM